MSYTENALVIHRVGGLEGNLRRRSSTVAVIHRVGGLEVLRIISSISIHVIHRVGGLEGAGQMYR